MIQILRCRKATLWGVNRLHGPKKDAEENCYTLLPGSGLKSFRSLGLFPPKSTNKRLLFLGALW